MLQLILGISGTGKTTLLYERILACVQAGKKAILIVPEQYSFESEKALYRKLGAQKALLVEVLSFTRLCDRIFREYGGMAGVHLEETAKYLLMSVVLEELGKAGALRAYGKNYGNAAFAAAMCGIVGELKTANVTPEQLEEAARSGVGEAFSDKLRDIGLICQTFAAAVANGYDDPDDHPARACKLLEGEDFFSGYEVFIDGFMAFMGAEWRMLRLILEQSPMVTVALTCAGLAGSGIGPFAAPGKTALRLVETARQAGIKVAAPTVLDEPRRFGNPALAYLAKEYPAICPDLSAGKAEGVCAVGCEDIYDEVEYVAAQICALVRAGYRYREIAVIGRSLDNYLIPLQTVFQRDHIPFFTDLREDIQVHPLVSGLLSALDAVRGNFQTDLMLSLSKNPILGIQPEDAGELENYCFIWGVRGKDWLGEFSNHPEGMEKVFTDEDTGRLERLNQIRETLVAPLKHLRERLKDCDGGQFARAAFFYLEECQAAQHLQEMAAAMPELQAKSFLEKSAQVWDIAVDLLDIFGGALADSRYPLGRMADLLRLGFASVDIGQLPQTLDQVIVGTADKIRPDAPRAVFVIGLNEGLFPQWGAPAGILSAQERSQLREKGFDLLRTPDQSASFEQYFVYFALTQASERLWLTYPMRGASGEGLSPSGVFRQVEAVLGVKAGYAQRGLLERVYSEEAAMEELAAHWKETTPQQASLQAYFLERDPRRVRALEDAAGPRRFLLEENGAPQLLFGKEIRFSPSRLEQFYNCPFAYFCQVGLHLLPRRKAEFNPLESGSFLHLVLEQMVQKYGGKGLCSLTPDQIRAQAQEIIYAELAQKVQDLQQTPKRFQYLFGRLVDTSVRLIQRLAAEFSQSTFEPVAFELPIGRGQEVGPMKLRDQSGARVFVEGIVDRVDAFMQDGKRYLRVVDYKSGQKVFDLSEVYYGLNMQMLIYLFTLAEHGGPGTVPAGVLYMPAKDRVITAGRHTDAQEIFLQRQKYLKMSGLLLEDRGVLGAMEKNLSGIYIPVKEKKDGGLSGGPLVTGKQMELVCGQVKRNILRAADMLHAGDIPPMPVEGITGHDPCAWCAYHNICTHEPGDPVRQIAQMDRQAVLEAMGKEEQDG